MIPDVKKEMLDNGGVRDTARSLNRTFSDSILRWLQKAKTWQRRSRQAASVTCRGSDYGFSQRCVGHRACASVETSLRLTATLRRNVYPINVAFHVTDVLRNSDLLRLIATPARPGILFSRRCCIGFLIQ